MTALPIEQSPFDLLLARGGQRAWRILHSGLKNQDPHLWTGGDGQVSSLSQALEMVADAVEDEQASRKAAASRVFPPIAGSLKQAQFPPIADSITTADTVQITVDEELSLNAWLVLNSPYKFHWLCAGVGVGKSWLAARYVRQRILTNPETVGLIAANTHTQLAQSTLPHLFEMLDTCFGEENYVINKRPPDDWGATSKFKGGFKNVISVFVAVGRVAHILIRSLTGWKRIRGANLGWFVVDEIADAPEGAFTELKRRLRCKKSKKLQGLIFGIPDLPGDNWTWNEFNPEDPKARKYYRVTFQSSTEAKHLDWEDYLLPMLRTTGPMEALQEIFARIVINQIGKIYYAYQDGINNEGCKDYDPARPIYFTMDFNIMSNSPTSGVLVQLHESADGSMVEAHVIDEIVIPNGDTLKACNEFLARYGTHRSEVWFYGDASGAHTQTVTEYQVAADVLGPVFGARLQIPKITANPLISERVAAVNAKLRSAMGVSSMFISKKCKELLLDLRKLMPQRSKDGKQVVEGKIDKSDAARSHTSDALGYLIRFLFPPFKLQAKRRAIKANY